MVTIVDNNVALVPGDVGGWRFNINTGRFISDVSAGDSSTW